MRCCELPGRFFVVKECVYRKCRSRLLGCDAVDRAGRLDDVAKNAGRDIMQSQKEKV